MDARLKTGGGIALIAALILLLPAGRKLCLMLLYAATLAYLLFPAAQFAEKKLHLSSGTAALTAFLLLLLLPGACLWLGLPAMGRQISLIRSALPGLLEALREKTGRLGELLMRSGLPEKLGEKLLLRLDRAREAADGTLLLTPLIAFYLLRDREAVFSLLTRLLPSRVRPQALLAAHEIRRELGVYVRGQVLISLLVGLLTALGLALIGVPAAPVLGAGMALFNLIPYFGPWLGAIPVLLMSAGGGVRLTLFSAAVILAVQQAENLFIAPNLIAGTSRLHPALVIAALLAGGWLGGLGGMLYAVPALLVGRAVLRTAARAKTPSAL